MTKDRKKQIKKDLKRARKKDRNVNVMVMPGEDVTEIAAYCIERLPRHREPLKEQWGAFTVLRFERTEYIAW